MQYAFDVFFGAIADRSFGEFDKRTDLWQECVFHFATHCLGYPAKRRQRDSIIGFSFFELLNGLSACVDMSADFFKRQSEGFANSGEPTRHRSRREVVQVHDVTVELRKTQLSEFLFHGFTRHCIA